MSIHDVTLGDDKLLPIDANIKSLSSNESDPGLIAVSQTGHCDLPYTDWPVNPPPTHTQTPACCIGR